MSTEESAGSEEYSAKDIAEKTIVGLTEEVIISGNSGKKELIARIDTGATKSSIDLTLASELKLGPVIDSRLIKSAHGTKLRPVVKASVKIQNRNIKAKFTLADRSHLRYPVLIGQNILKMGFLVDPIRRVDKPIIGKTLVKQKK
jgi:hypothetical protein